MSYETAWKTSDQGLETMRFTVICLRNNGNSNQLSVLFCSGSGDYQHGRFPTQLRQPDGIPAGEIRGARRARCRQPDEKLRAIQQKPTPQLKHSHQGPADYIFIATFHFNRSLNTGLGDRICKQFIYPRFEKNCKMERAIRLGALSHGLNGAAG